MTTSPLSPARTARRAALLALPGNPVVVIFLATNLVNAGNLAFNMIFSRLMGPELFGDLAMVLSIKLALLGMLGAMQMAVSHDIARATGAEGTCPEQDLARINRLGFILAIPTCLGIAAAMGLGSVDARLGLSSPWLLTMLFAALPFALPLVMLRGVMLGHLRAGAFALSLGVEMLVRLIGACLAWWAGWGIEGVVASVALSIPAGWLVIRNGLPELAFGDLAPTPATARLARSLAAFAIPMACLYGAQVVLLDGDIVVAKLFLGDTDAGHVAAFSLFQRIQFFACFGLAGVLLPAVARDHAAGRAPNRAIALSLGLFAAVAVPLVALAWAAPDLALTTLVGAGFREAAPLLWMPALSAAAFTLGFLAATLLSGFGHAQGIWLLAAGAVLQSLAMLAAAGLARADLADLLQIKLIFQTGLALGLVLLSARVLGRRNQPVPSGITPLAGEAP